NGRSAPACSSSSSWPVTAVIGIAFRLAMLPDHIAQHSGRLDGLQPAVELHRRVYIAVAQEAPNRLVVAGMVLQVDRSRRMAVLVQGDPQTGYLLNAFGDLDAHQMRPL